MLQDVAIMDIGSGKITVLIGERGVNNTINIIGKGESNYDGYINEQWVSPEQLASAMGAAVSDAEANSRTQIRHLYIGVPGDFCRCACRNVSLSLSKKRKITEGDVDALHEQGDTFKLRDDFTIINNQPIYYTVDGERRVMMPVGLTSTKLSGFISYIFADSEFTRFIDEIMEEIGIESFEYVSSVLAEMLCLYDDKVRDRWVVLIDVGYLTTNVIVGRGDGILSMYHFPLGGGHIEADLHTAFDIPFSQAQSLKQKVVLSLTAGDDDVYSINISRDETKSFSAKEVNLVAGECIKSIAKTVEECLSKCPHEFPDNIPYSLTGGGISYMRGAKDCMSKYLGRPVEIVSPPQPQYNRPHMSSSIGLLDMALNGQAPAKKKGFLSRLFGK